MVVTLKKKIIISFVISAAVIAALVMYVFINFGEISKEISFIELTDTIRTKSLQLRRHEKNFFLYSPQKGAEESKEVHRYIGEIKETVALSTPEDKAGQLLRLKGLVNEYERLFVKIETESHALTEELKRTKPPAGTDVRFFPLIELTFLERPRDGAEFLRCTFDLPDDHRLVTGLEGLDDDIKAIRRVGEEMIAVSKELDKSARDKVERVISGTHKAIFLFFPLFLLVGMGTLIYITGSVTRRLNLLADAVEHTGKGPAPYSPVASELAGADEVGQLIMRFNEMEALLADREEEINRKNRELLQSKKLAAIGTLASGVAHELNNPLNNIYISAQVLAKEVRETDSPAIKEVIGDIMGQTARVKRIVSDLLEYARGRQPQMREVDLGDIIAGAFKLLATTVTYGTDNIKFTIDTDKQGLSVMADHEQMERVFINLFTNAITAMSGEGELNVTVAREGAWVVTRVTDTGPGIKPEDIDKVFEPFYTTKDKGTGLGLAIVFNIVKKHGGDIKVENVPGKGARFTITLPKGT